MQGTKPAEPLDVHKLFSIVIKPAREEGIIKGNLHDASCNDERQVQKNGFDLRVRLISGEERRINVEPSDTVYRARLKIEYMTGIPADQQRLISAGKQLQDQAKIFDCASVDEPVFLMPRFLGGGGTFFLLDGKLLDPPFDYDFSKRSNDGKVYKRGKGFVYKRPYGWRRYALKVRGRYGDNTWLGRPGSRTEGSEDEWPVSYHGTARDNARSIAEDGYKARAARARARPSHRFPCLAGCSG